MIRKLTFKFQSEAFENPGKKVTITFPFTKTNSFTKTLSHFGSYSFGEGIC